VEAAADAERDLIEAEVRVQALLEPLELIRLAIDHSSHIFVRHGFPESG
jgi:hypothetical protein